MARSLPPTPRSLTSPVQLLRKAEPIRETDDARDRATRPADGPTPRSQPPLWESVAADCGDLTEVMSMRWFVGDAAKMWPEAGPRNLANAVLAVIPAR
jgi:hypothetical protein